jgi:hypothetical protein
MAQTNIHTGAIDIVAEVAANEVAEHLAVAASRDHFADPINLAPFWTTASAAGGTAYCRNSGEHAATATAAGTSSAETNALPVGGGGCDGGGGSGGGGGGSDSSFVRDGTGDGNRTVVKVVDPTTGTTREIGLDGVYADSDGSVAGVATWHTPTKFSVRMSRKRK